MQNLNLNTADLNTYKYWYTGLQDTIDIDVKLTETSYFATPYNQVQMWNDSNAADFITRSNHVIIIDTNVQ